MFKKIQKYLLYLLIIMLCGCSNSSSNNGVKNHRDNTPHIYENESPKELTIGNDLVTIDLTNTSKGYLMVEYLGTNEKVKVRITLPNQEDPYTYDKHAGNEAFPLTGGNGTYKIQIFENVSDNKYSTLFSQEFDVQLENEFDPFLYPSQYVNYNKNTRAIDVAKQIVEKATDDLDAVTKIYHYTINTISYDDQKADQVKDGSLKGYLPDVDKTLETKKGICFDYAALMATMLRTQNIPTRLEIGYAKNEEDIEKSIYHAWISVYIDQIGWIDNYIEFDGHSWKIMDPTFAAGNQDKKTKNYITNQDNYQTKYLY